jgi:hypothetical protein
LVRFGSQRLTPARPHSSARGFRFLHPGPARLQSSARVCFGLQWDTPSAAVAVTAVYSQKRPIPRAAVAVTTVPVVYALGTQGPLPGPARPPLPAAGHTPSCSCAAGPAQRASAEGRGVPAHTPGPDRGTPPFPQHSPSGTLPARNHFRLGWDRVLSRPGPNPPPVLLWLVG